MPASTLRRGSPQKSFLSYWKRLYDLFWDQKEISSVKMIENHCHFWSTVVYNGFWVDEWSNFKKDCLIFHRLLFSKIGFSNILGNPVKYHTSGVSADQIDAAEKYFGSLRLYFKMIVLWQGLVLTWMKL